MLIGYARVSTEEQSINLQLDALAVAGCGDKIFTDSCSAMKADRPGLDAALKYARDGDTLVVWRLDRLGRSLKDLINIVENLASQGIGLKSLTEGIDTTTSGGRLIFHVFGAIAQFERELIIERTNAGLAAARARGKLGGRRKQHSDEMVRKIRKEAETSTLTIKELCQEFKISTYTYYNRKLKK